MAVLKYRDPNTGKFIPIGGEEKNILTAKLTSNYDIKETNKGEFIKNFVLYNKIGTKLTVQNGVIKIGAGVSKVLVTYNSTCSSVADATRSFTYLSKNGALLSQESYYFDRTGQQITVTLVPLLVDVTEGDEFYIICYGQAGNRIMGGTLFAWTAITIEVIE